MSPHRALLLTLSTTLAILEPRVAGAVGCTAQTSGTWGPIESGTASWSCGGGGVPTPNDHFIIPSGITVTLVGDVTQNDVINIGIDVQSGAIFSAVVDESTGSLRLTLGEEGLECDPGSTCELRGAYRETGTPTPGLVADRSSLEPFRVGELVLGAGPTIRMEFPEEEFDAAQAGPSGALASLSEVAPGDVACFYDPDPTDFAVPADANYCYEVAAVDWLASPPWLELDVRQGNADHPAMPLARREVVESQIGAAVSAGERQISLPDGVITTDRLHVGRFLRFADALGDPEPRSYRILHSDATNDTVTIGDRRGFSSAHPAGTTVWIDYGWEPGDPFFVMSPVTVTSASPLTVKEFDSGATLRGTLILRAVLFDAIENVDITGFGAIVLEMKDVWLRDMGNENSNSIGLLDLGADLLVDHLTITGNDNTFPRTHAIVARGTAPFEYDITLRDVAIRHHGDDCWVVSSFDGDFDAERFRCQFASDIAESCNLLSFVNHSGPTDATDVECVDCTRGNPGTGVTGAVFVPGSGDAEIDGLLVWGAEARLNNPTTGSQTLDDVMVLGGGNNLNGPIIPRGTSGCVVRGFDALSGGPERGIILQGGDVSDCVFDTVTVHDRWVSKTDETTDVENVAFIDVHTLSASDESTIAWVDHDIPGIETASYEHVTIAFRPGVETNVHRPIFLEGAIGALGMRLRGLVVANHLLAAGNPGPPYALFATGSTVMAATDWGGEGPCLSNNDQDLSPGAQALPPPTLVQAPDLGFHDEAAGRFDPVPGGVADLNGCGIRRGVDAPGVKRFAWMHAISKLAPEMMADDGDGDGIPEDGLAEACEGGDTEACSDNCVGLFNPDQADADDDGQGDDCDVTCEGFGDDTTLTSLSASSGWPGRAIVAYGTGFGPNVQVFFDDRQATASGLDAQTASVRVPTLALVGSAPVVRLSNPEGCTAQSTLPFTVTAPPATVTCGLGAELALLLAILWRRWSVQRSERDS